MFILAMSLLAAYILIASLNDTDIDDDDDMGGGMMIPATAPTA